jgi:deoxyribose-phosphate aldolase
VTGDRDALIEAVTREVLAALAGGALDDCMTCVGDCVAHSAEKVRTVLAAGATRVSYVGDGADVPTDLAGFIDHTLLRPDATAAEIDRMCAEAIEYGFASVCVNPTWAKRVADALKGTRWWRPASSGSPPAPRCPRSRRWRRGGCCATGRARSTWC